MTQQERVALARLAPRNPLLRSAYGMARTAKQLTGKYRVKVDAVYVSPSAEPHIEIAERVSRALGHEGVTVLKIVVRNLST